MADFLKIKIIILFYYLFQKNTPECSKGCLICSINDDCQLCDIFKGMILQSGFCEKVITPNCLWISAEGVCALCSQDYYFDTQTNQCIGLSSDEQTPNCISYNSQKKCEQCDQNFYLLNYNCFNVNYEIKNCLYYGFNSSALGTKTFCSKCKQDFIFNHENDECIPKPPIENCHLYSYINCEKCQNGYVKNENLYLINIFGNTETVFQNILKKLQSNETKWNGELVCQKTIFEENSCLSYQSYNVCEKCDDKNYYLQNGLCIKNPFSVITNCLAYRSLYECQQCQNGFKLNNPQKCSPVNIVNNCITYDGSATSTVCTQCADDFYVQTDTQCAPRVNSLTINNCTKKFNKIDRCEECSAGFVLTFDNLNCLTQIPNCQDYKASTKNSILLTCQKCSNGYYAAINTKTGASSCVQGEIEHCLTYQDDKEECSVCENGYYLLSEKCLPHTPIENCLQYHHSKINTCLFCNTGFFPFPKQQICTKKDSIDNCIQYSQNGSECEKCAERFYLKDKKCNILQNNDHCKYADSNGTCTECYSQYVFDSNKLCVLPFNFVTANCLTTPSSTDTVDTLCDTCTQKHIPFNFQNQAICVDNIQLRNIPIDKNSNPLCIKYGPIGATHKCYECQNNKKVNSSNNNLCIDNCLDDQYLISDNLDGKINYCVSASKFTSQDFTGATEIARASFANFQTNEWHASDFFIKSFKASSYSPFIDISNLGNQVSFPFDQLLPVDDYKNSIYPYAILYRGYNMTLEPKVNWTKNGNCELFQKVIANDVCVKCQWGQQLINDGTETGFDCNTSFTECQNQYFYNNIQSMFNALLSCHHCQNAAHIIILNVRVDEGNNFIFTKLQISNGGVIDCQNAASNVPNCLIEAKRYKNDGTETIANPSICVACKPGFAPKDNNQQYQIFGIEECISITYAHEQDNLIPKLANATSACLDPDDKLKMFAFASFEQQSCISINTPFCYIGDALTNKCTICQSGYFLNADSKCDPMPIPNCLTDNTGSLFIPNKQETNITQSKKEVRQYYTLAYMKQTLGCLICQNGHTRVVFDKADFYLCIESDYLKIQDNVSMDTKFIKNCFVYKNTITLSKFICKQCYQNYAVVDGGSVCVPKPRNCLIVELLDNTICHTCEENYINIKGICQLKQISNCAVYQNTQGVQLSLQQCLICQDGYYLNTISTMCIKGVVSDCKAYAQGSQSKCSACLSGFFLVSAGPFNYCYPIQGNTFCKIASNTNCADMSNCSFSCTTCLTNSDIYGSILWTLVEDYKNAPQNICMPFTPIPNCQTYNTNLITIDDKSFSCLQCKKDYYYSQTDRQCLQRNNIYSQCLQYDDFSDTCITCPDKYFPDVDNNGICTPYPTGIQNCLEYENQTICKKCDNRTYLSPDRQLCLESIIIPNCNIYADRHTCSECDFNYFMQSGELCVKAIAQNCLTYTNISICQSCPSTSTNSYMFLDNDGVISCVLKSMQNCLEYTKNMKKVECSICDDLHYINEYFECLPIQKIIPNCKIYHNATQCKQCHSKYFLMNMHMGMMSVTSCMKHENTVLDQNCDSLHHQSIPFCSQCKFGFLLRDGKCVQCENSSTCLQCDSQTPSRCSVCATGYDMDSSGQCNQNSNFSAIITYADSEINSAIFISLLGLFLIYF